MRLKQISKRSLAIILTVLMVFSSLMVGSISTANASVGTGTIYFDNSNTNWTNVYFFIGHDSYVRSYTMSKVSGTDNIYSYTVSGWSDANGFYFANGNGGVSGGSSSKNINNSASDLGLSARTAKYTSFTAKYCYVPSASSGTNISCTTYNYDATYIVAGSETLCGSSWDPADTDNKMTRNSDGTYSITYTSVAAGSYEFKVTDGSWSNSWPANNYALTVTGTKNVTITFTPSTGAVSVTQVNAITYVAPTFSNSTTALSVDRNATLDLSSAIAATCSCGSDVTYDIGCSPTTGVTLSETNKTFKSTTADTYTLTVVAKNANDTSKTATKTITVTVNPLDVTVTAGTSTGGTVKVNGGASATVKEGTEVTLTNTPNTGYEFVKYQANGSDITTPYKPTAAATITGVFEPISYTINKTAGTGGTISGPDSYVIGDEVVLTATPNAGYELATFTVNGSPVDGNTYSFTATADNLVNITAEATFTAKTYTITYEEETGIDLTVPSSAKYNDDVTVTINSITPGYECKFITVDGKQYEVIDSTVTFKMPAKNVTITTDVDIKALSTPVVTIVGSDTLNGVGNTYKTPLTVAVSVNTADQGVAEVDLENCKFTVPDGCYVVEETVGLVTNYYFYADAPGTYTVEYTGAVKSTIDNTTVKTGTDTITITVSYSATQQAYKDLEASFEQYGNESSANYDTSSEYWTAYENAKNSASALLTGMPTEDSDTMIASYEAAQTALEDAYEGLDNCSNESTVYILTQKSSNVKIYGWNGVNCDLPNETGKAMELVANYNNSRYLWKTTFKGTCEFLIYSENSTSPSSSSVKLTGGIVASATGQTYYFNRNDSANSTATDYATSYDMLALKGNGISVDSSVIMMQGTAFNVADAFPVSVKSSVYDANSSLYNVTYYIDGEEVTTDTWTTEVQGQHTVYAVISGGTSNGATYETVTTKTINFEVTEDLTTDWDFYGYGNDRVVETDMNPADMIKGTMNGHAFAYYELNVDNTDDFRFMIGKDGTQYQHQNNGSQSVIEYANKFGADVTINNHGDTENYAKVNGLKKYYIVLYYANTDYETWNGVDVDNSSNSKAVVCAYSELPGDTYKDKYKVTIEDGRTNQVTNEKRGDSYLEGDTSLTSVRKEYTDLTVQMSTDITKVTNYLGDFTGYAQKVYGYSIMMEMQDGSKQVTSVSGSQISSPALGKYTASFTFPENIKSANITPVFVSSDEFAESRGLTFTTLYLMLTPGNNLYENTYEPKYYTWRATSESASTVTIDGKQYANRAEGTYPGQKLIYVGSNMYMAIVESKINGVLFNDGGDGNTQTFDYNEFIKLQQLGYNNITFEPKKNSQETVAASMNSTYAGNGNKVYATESNNPTTITSALTKAEFQLDVNIEGYYIDVFGNKLVDTTGNPISQKNLRAEMTAAGTEVNTSTEITALLNKMGKDLTTDDGRRTLYGARYGWYSETGYYGMTYAVRVYYFNHLNKMVSQQVSGYGTIEGAQSVSDSSKTNAVYAAENNITLQHAQGSYPASSAATTFVNGYELIDDDYKNVPYLVSYKIKTSSRATGSDTDQTGYSRIDGKWYYQSATPQITVDVKTGLMNEDGTIVKSNGIITDQGTTYGSVSINSATSITVDQGTEASIISNPTAGYKLVGYYTEDGTFISSTNPLLFTCANNTTVYAVFQKLGEGTLTITNGVYRGNNPKDGEGNGSVGVKLTIFNADGTVKDTFTGTTSVTADIVEGEGYQWELTGKASGADKFIAFRQPEEQADGVYYYSKLDAEYIDPDTGSVTSQPSLEADGETYTYKSDIITEFNWNDYDTHSLSFNFYTDFQKVSVYATLNYEYNDRYGNPKTYTVSGILLDENEINNGYKPSTKKIRENAPHIDEVFNSCTWTCTDVDLSNLRKYGDSVATLVAVQELKKFDTTIAIGPNDPEPKMYKDDPYNTQRYLDAPATLENEATGETENFMYWMRYSIDSNGSVNYNSGEIFSYDKKVGIRVTFDSYYEAVYGEGTLDSFTTNLQDPSYTREKYTDANGNTKDYVYADFIVQFETNKAESFKIYASTDTNLRFGLVLERDTTSKYTGAEGESKVTPTYTEENVKNTILSLNNKITDTVITTNGWTVCSDTTSKEYNNYYYLYDLTTYADSLSDLGRMDYVVKLANTEANRGMVYNVYTYIIYLDDEGKQQIILSKPKMMNIYDIGIIEDGVSE